MGDNQDRRKAFLYGVSVLLLLVIQKVLGKIGGKVADLVPYGAFDPYDAYAWVSVHHIVEALIAVVLILFLSRLWKVDFGFHLGERKSGSRYVLVYTAAFAGVTLICHILMSVSKTLPVYDFPLNRANILGTLGFQLFLSGPVEEILFRAIPITILVRVWGKSIEIKRGITLETVIAAFLFTAAHMKLTLSPFSIEADYFQLFYAFAVGIIYGKVYQESRSIVYPMFMHSISNVMMVGTGYLFLLLK